MLRNIARLGVLALVLPLAGACSGANASGRSGDRAVADNARTARPAAHDYTLASGRMIELKMVTGLTSRRNHAGDPIVATAVRPALSATGDTVIPAGAEFRGTVREIAAAPTPRAQAHLQLAFTEVKLGETARAIQVRVTAMATHLEGRGITGGTVAKVGAGALIGGLAGRLIGRSGTGTVVGAAAGAAAGGVYAHETRDLDIILPAGSVVHVTLAGPFGGEVAVK